MLLINSYEDFLAVLQAITFDDPVNRNEAKNALAVFRRKKPELYVKYSKMCGWKEKSQEKEKNKKGDNSDNSDPKLKKLRNNARSRLMKGKFGFDLPSWITEKDLLSSIDQLDVSDMITETGEPVQRVTLYRKSIKLAAANGRIDEVKLRRVILNRCRIIWNNITNHPDFSFEALKRFILEFATTEELADAGIDHNKLVELMFDDRIKGLDI